MTTGSLSTNQARWSFFPGRHFIPGLSGIFHRNMHRDEKNLIVDSYAVWRVDDPVKFLKTVKDEMSAEDKLRDIVLSELGIAIGQYDLAALVSTDPEAVKLDEMIEKITLATDNKVREYGIKVEDVRIKVLNFPQQNKEKVFRRMMAERGRIARTYRSEGNAKAEKIRAQADVEDAREEKEEKIHRAEAYYNTVVPDAQGQASRLMASAKGYRARVTNEARGDVAKFEAMLRKYEKDIGVYSKAVTDFRLHTETMEKVLARVKKYIVNTDSENGELVNLRFFSNY